ncbi:MAG: hypothetical protein Q4D46_03620 [Erysipelotrichaceae bacterium]|nr:hypothetical protein [Erysipelotrichaceae bacterium]MDO5121147.1 hypothetical protein [Erysipelotrichaceae bacterium]
MNITVALQDVRMFSFFWLLAALTGLAAAVFLVHQVLGKHRQIQKAAEEEASLQDRYLGKLDHLEQEYLHNQISVRNAYQALSRTVREYGSELTGIPMDRLTLAEIRLHGSGKAAHLVERYYEPEFAEYAEDKFIHEIHYAKEVIRAWN